MKKIQENQYYRFFEILLAILIIGILSILILIDNRFSYVYQTHCIVSNLVIAGLFMLLLLINYILRKKGIVSFWAKRKNPLLENSRTKQLEIKLERRNFLLLALILFGIQLIVAWQIYFKTGWDCGQLVTMAQQVAFHNADIGDNVYFSLYPNNVLLVAVFAAILRFTRFLGFEADYFPLVIVGCFLVNAAGFFMMDCIKKVTDKLFIALSAWVIFMILAGLSPWISIPYSDTYSIIFPIFCVWLYVYKTEKNKYWVWAVIGFCATIGSFVKPTVLLTLIAIFITEICKFIGGTEKSKIKNVIKSGSLFLMVMLVGIVLATGVNEVAKYKLHCNLDKEKAVTPMHYLMMGLNYKTGGTYDQWDVNYSAATPTKAARNEKAFYEAKARVMQMGLSGTGRHFTRKLLTNFNDGVFAWGNEGEFYWNIPERKNGLAKVLRNYYYESGTLYPVFQLVGQTAWMLVLCCMAGLMIKSRKKATQLQGVTALSILAICCFVMLFEARARYLFLYIPLFILCGAMGFQRILEVPIKEFAKKEEKEENKG